MQRVLVLGATGAMGQYLVPELLALGYAVDGVTLDDVSSDKPNLRFIKNDAKDRVVLEELLSAKYDGVVDFMSYSTKEFEEAYKLFLDNTKHYIFLSSCRVYANLPPINEKTPRLLDYSDDQEFLATDDYSLAKARQENILTSSNYSNWTIVRPATTYSRGRFQLVTLEAQTVIHRMLSGKTIVLPEDALSCQATMTWGGDVAKMIARLMFKKEVYREDYIVATGEHNSWKEIAEMYNQICPFKYVTASVKDYLNIISKGESWIKYQLIYARLYDRITDNTKILQATGLKQSDLMGLKEGLKYEFERSKDFDWDKYANDFRNSRMDAYLQEKGLK